MYSKIAFASSSRVFHLFLFKRSICIDDQKLSIISIIALSSLSPTDPKDGSSPAERIFFPKSHEVNCPEPSSGGDTGLLEQQELLVECLGGRLPPEGLARPSVQRVSDGFDALRGPGYRSQL